MGGVGQWHRIRFPGQDDYKFPLSNTVFYRCIFLNDYLIDREVFRRVCVCVCARARARVRERKIENLNNLPCLHVPYHVGTMRVKITYQEKGAFCPFSHSAWALKEILNWRNETNKGYPTIFSELGKQTDGSCTIFFSSVKCHLYHIELLKICNKTLIKFQHLEIPLCLST